MWPPTFYHYSKLPSNRSRETKNQKKVFKQCTKQKQIISCGLAVEDFFVARMCLVALF